MKLAFYIARRYLFSRKTQNVINVISGISILGITVGTFALLVILSAFNGLENLVISLFNSFDPDNLIRENLSVSGSSTGRNRRSGICQIQCVLYARLTNQLGHSVNSDLQ